MQFHRMGSQADCSRRAWKFQAGTDCRGIQRSAKWIRWLNCTCTSSLPCSEAFQWRVSIWNAESLRFLLILLWFLLIPLWFHLWFSHLIPLIRRITFGTQSISYIKRALLTRFHSMFDVRFVRANLALLASAALWLQQPLTMSKPLRVLNWPFTFIHIQIGPGIRPGSFDFGKFNYANFLCSLSRCSGCSFFIVFENSTDFKSLPSFGY